MPPLQTPSILIETSLDISRDATKFGPVFLPDGSVLFRLWAPQAKSVSLCLAGNDVPGENASQKNIKSLPMMAEAEGWFRYQTDLAAHGIQYRFQVTLEGGDVLDVPDPASRAQSGDVHGWSILKDPRRFEWCAHEAAWKGRPWQETVLYEVHTGTFSPEGTFQGIQKKLDYLQKLGVTAIELMPVADFPGKFNWGYDGVLIYAPDERYGSPEDLKELIQTAHEKGLMVFLDVVYNHFGPEGNYLHTYASSFFNPAHHTPWGAAINYDGSMSHWVREFFIQNTLYWLEEFHFDGLRFDAVDTIIDDSEKNKAGKSFLLELVERVRTGPGKTRHVHLVLENVKNQAMLLEGSAGFYGYDAQWNDDFHHVAHVLLTQENEGYYCDFSGEHSERSPLEHLAVCLTQGFAYQGHISSYHGGTPRGESSRHLLTTAFVNFLQNHDQIGNRAFGERLSTLLTQNRVQNLNILNAFRSILLLAPSIPLIFMGEEWQTQTPFLFFSDLGPELGPKVRDGRRKEFEKFSAFQDPRLRERIPNPNETSTFLQSKLPWQEIETPEYKQQLALTTDLLHLRMKEIVPRLGGMTGKSSCYTLFGSHGLMIRWELPGQSESLVLIANIGDSALPMPEISGMETARMIWPSGDPVSASSGPSIGNNHLTKNTLMPWEVLWFFVHA